jgi:hypothetical protein
MARRDTFLSQLSTRQIASNLNAPSGNSEHPELTSYQVRTCEAWRERLRHERRVIHEPRRPLSSTAAQPFSYKAAPSSALIPLSKQVDRAIAEGAKVQAEAGRRVAGRPASAHTAASMARLREAGRFLPSSSAGVSTGLLSSHADIAQNIVHLPHQRGGTHWQVQRLFTQPSAGISIADAFYVPVSTRSRRPFSAPLRPPFLQA